jgi:Lactonase, 7-bladed beta-propeller
LVAGQRLLSWQEHWTLIPDKIFTSVTFYRCVSINPVVFEVTPEFELKHESLHHPDGLGFSQCGSWLAVANHGGHSVSLFRRRRNILSSKIKYGPRPVMVLKDSAFRHPHSVVFTPLTGHLVVTNAGANYFSAYQPDSGYSARDGRNRLVVKRLSRRIRTSGERTTPTPWKEVQKVSRSTRTKLPYAVRR